MGGRGGSVDEASVRGKVPYGSTVRYLWADAVRRSREVRSTVTYSHIGLLAHVASFAVTGLRSCGRVGLKGGGHGGGGACIVDDWIFTGWLIENWIIEDHVVDWIINGWVMIMVDGLIGGRGEGGGAGLRL